MEIFYNILNTFVVTFADNSLSKAKEKEAIGYK